MAIVKKSDPIGIDAPLDEIQDAVYNHLTNNCKWTKYESYHRAYKNQKDSSVIPEVYTRDKEYKEDICRAPAP